MTSAPFCAFSSFLLFVLTFTIYNVNRIFILNKVFNYLFIALFVSMTVIIITVVDLTSPSSRIKWDGRQGS